MGAAPKRHIAARSRAHGRRGGIRAFHGRETAPRPARIGVWALASLLYALFLKEELEGKLAQKPKVGLPDEAYEAFLEKCKVFFKFLR